MVKQIPAESRAVPHIRIDTNPDPGLHHPVFLQLTYCVFLISDFRRDLNIVYFLLGISPASNCSWPTFRNPVSVPSSKAGCTVYTVHPAFEDGTDTGFRNVGQLQFDAGEIPRRKYTTHCVSGDVTHPVHVAYRQQHLCWQ